MFGRRVAGLLRLPAQTRLQTGPFASQYELPLRTLAVQPRRTFATPGRPRSVVGEPSKTVKRAVKRQAAKATTTKESPAKEKNEAKKKSAATKKPAAKKKVPKKDLTEEQKAVKAAKFARAKVSDLKKAALSPPKLKQANAWTVFFSEKQKDAPSRKGDPVKEIRAHLAERTKSIAAAWKERSTADTEHYNHLANAAKEASQAEFKRWVESHTPEAIDIANRARQTLRRQLKKGGRGPTRNKWPVIADERQAKGPVNAYMQFNINRHASGDFRNIPVTERSKQIALEWKALNDEEKKKYKALQQEDQKRWQSEYTNVYGHAPPALNGGHAQPAAVAAAAA